MIPAQNTFQRVEKKYLLTATQYAAVNEILQTHMVPDAHREDAVFSLYFDTPDYRLIRRSIDKPLYKEKLRIRSYGFPRDDMPVFIEIKKKYKKVVYKRRVALPCRAALEYLLNGKRPEPEDAGRLCPPEAGKDDMQQTPATSQTEENRRLQSPSVAGSDAQILKEISWFSKLYEGLAPSMLISYHRQALCGVENRALRITFDTEVSYRHVRSLSIEEMETMADQPLLPAGQYLMEIKIPGAMPLWLADLLDREKIYPTSFSKYGTAYRKTLSKGEIHYD